MIQVDTTKRGVELSKYFDAVFTDTNIFNDFDAHVLEDYFGIHSRDMREGVQEDQEELIFQGLRDGRFPLIAPRAVLAELVAGQDFDDYMRRIEGGAYAHKFGKRGGRTKIIWELHNQNRIWYDEGFEENYLSLVESRRFNRVSPVDKILTASAFRYALWNPEQRVGLLSADSDIKLAHQHLMFKTSWTEVNRPTLIYVKAPRFHRDDLIPKRREVDYRN